MALQHIVLCLLVSAGCSLGVFWLEGPESGIKDDSPSHVVCPNGYYAAECHCHDASICDGTRLYTDNTRKCTAFKRWSVRGKVKAMVQCKSATGYDIKVMYHLTSPDNAIKCPEGFAMEFCTKNDKWSHFRNTVLFYTLTEDDITCGWKKASGTLNYDILMSVVCIIEPQSEEIKTELHFLE
ncbi:uncharacterized protein [Watersipora subatra]|uniref:uncharacterized protein n=1 Tax=Watersipora subatra TaxID=2589382 RepID=UPI00355C6647